MDSISSWTGSSELSVHDHSGKRDRLHGGRQTFVEYSPQTTTLQTGNRTSSSSAVSWQQSPCQTLIRWTAVLHPGTEGPGIISHSQEISSPEKCQSCHMDGRKGNGTFSQGPFCSGVTKSEIMCWASGVGSADLALFRCSASSGLVQPPGGSASSFILIVGKTFLCPDLTMESHQVGTDRCHRMCGTKTTAPTLNSSPETPAQGCRETII